MATGCICRNQIIDYQGNAYRLTELLPNRHWAMESMFDRTTISLPQDELMQCYALGEITLRVGLSPAEEVSRRLRAATEPPVTLSRKTGKAIIGTVQLPNGDQRTLEQQRHVALKAAIQKAKLAELASKYPLGSAIQEEAIRTGWPGIFGVPAPDKLPAPSTLWRHQKKLQEAGGDRRELVAKHHLKGRRVKELPDVVADLLGEVVQEIYLTPQRKTMREVQDELVVRIAGLNSISEEKLPVPPIQRVKDFIAELPAFDKHAARYGLQGATKKFRAQLAKVFASRPLERVELDATKIDLIAIDENGVSLGRPWLTLIIDVRTKCILGYCLTYEPPSLASLFECLRHALPTSPRFE